jgi:hypothetical protein
MANGYGENLEIDRIDVNGHYEPANCRWVTEHQQAANKRTSNRFVGVWKDKQGKYHAELMVNKKWAIRKSFDSYEDAVACRLDAERRFGINIERRGQ